MLNVGGGEFLVILLVALIVLGPTKLPEVAKQVGAMARELRRISAGFQNELKAALDDPVEEAARARGHKIVNAEEPAAPDTDDVDDVDDVDDEPASADEPEPEISTAEAAGMYDAAKTDDVAPDVLADETDGDAPKGPDPA